jgi:DMSO reductase anchor subunit
MSFGLFKLNMHLGKPLRFYRGFNNLRHSPVSREIAGVSLFFAGLAGYVFFTLFGGMIASVIGNVLTGTLRNLAAVTGILGASLGGYYMIKLYLIPARPFWNHWHTGAAFVSTALGLGALLLALTAWLSGALTNELGMVLASVAATGFALESIGLIAHARDLQAQGDEGAASFYEQTTTYGYPYWLRNGLLAISLLLALGMGFMGQVSGLAFGMLALTALTSGILGRALFYVLVIPTTMPGAFFWRNKGFVEHAKEVGLANMPQVGVVPDAH